MSADEQDEYDIEVLTWDGSSLVFETYDGAAWSMYTATVSGRTILGEFVRPEDDSSHTIIGTRAQVLAYGLAPRTMADRTRWQTRTRRELSALAMAGNPAPLTSAVSDVSAVSPPIPEVGLDPNRDDSAATRPQDYTLTEIGFDSTLPAPPGVAPLARHAHGYIARPTAPPPPGGYAIAIALNGHWGSAADVMDPNTWYWFGDAFARRNFMVVAVDMSHRPLGDRDGQYADFTSGDNFSRGNGTHPAIAVPGFDSDWSEDGERVWDAMRAIDYALSQPDVNRAHVLVTGLSMGGEVATWLGALDPRVTVTIPAGFSPDLSVMLYGGNHPCWRWTHGDVREYIDVSDLHALIAPRGLIVETGRQDVTYSRLATPFAGDKQVLRRARVAFSDAPERVVHYLHYDGHAYHFGEMGSPAVIEQGVHVPLVTAPQSPWTLDWQRDSQTVVQNATLSDAIAPLLP
jgi:dienelactone hydrolase